MKHRAGTRILRCVRQEAPIRRRATRDERHCATLRARGCSAGDTCLSCSASADTCMHGETCLRPAEHRTADRCSCCCGVQTTLAASVGRHGSRGTRSSLPVFLARAASPSSVVWHAESPSSRTQCRSDMGQRGASAPADDYDDARRDACVRAWLLGEVVPRRCHQPC